jgi:hypothetical protein
VRSQNIRIAALVLPGAVGCIPQRPVDPSAQIASDPSCHPGVTPLASVLANPTSIARTSETMGDH